MSHLRVGYLSDKVVALERRAYVGRGPERQNPSPANKDSHLRISKINEPFNSPRAGCPACAPKAKRQRNILRTIGGEKRI